MWFLERVHPGTAAYNVSSAIRLRGPLDAGALRTAWANLLQRHDALRSRFPLEDERPRCIVEERVRVEWERIVLGRWPAATGSQQDSPAGRGARAASCSSEAERVALTALEHFARGRFDIARGPLARAALASVNAEDHVVVLVLHHLIADGWSLRILHNELAELYNATVGAREAALPGDGGDYQEHVRLERTRTTREAVARGLDFWRKRLAGVQPLRLPCDSARPATRSLRGARCVAHLPDETTRALEALARACASSLFLVLELAFAVLLYRWTGERDIAIGAPFANRADAGTDGVVGLFVNTVVLRSEIDGARCFEELLAHHRDVSLEALEHGDVPFEAVVEELGPERSLGENPLFSAMFALQRAEAEVPDFARLDATLLDLDLASARFDLECTTWRVPQGLKVRLVYACDLFTEATGQRLLKRYVRLLELLASEPHTPVAQFDLLLEHERCDLLTRHAPLSHADLKCDVTALFEAQARRTPDARALQTAVGGLCYSELAAQARSVAASLHERGVGRGDVVAVCAAREAGLVVAMLGVMRCGATLLALDCDAPLARTALLLADAGASMALAGDASDVVPADGVRWMTLDEALTGEQSKCPVRHPTARDAVYVIYTSGTAGAPKGVVVEHRNVVNTLVGCREQFGFDASDRFLCLAAATFDIFYFEVLSALVCGACVRLVERGEVMDPARLAQLVRGATVMQAVPGLMREIVDALAAYPGAVPRMRHAITGGDTVPPALPGAIAEAFPDARVTILYGPTEAAMVCAGISLDSPATVHGHPLGGPLPNVTLRVYDERRELVPVGFAGEIYIGGAGVCRGYLGEPAQLAERFVTIDGERFYRSGDRGRWRSDGSLEFLGRLDDQVKIDGYRIEPAEIEAVAESLAEVREAAVVAYEARGSRRLHAYVVPVSSRRARVVAARRQIGDWRALFEHTYGVNSAKLEDDHDFTGWRSSYTDAPLSREQMEDWLESSLAEIAERLPRGLRRRPRILEIGCGTGLLLFGLAPACERYVATDFAPAVLERVRAGVNERGWGNVELHEREADDLSWLGRARFDAVILNSVVQYLPGIDHVRAILDRAMRRVAPAGFVFVGDVRNLALHEPFLAGVERFHERALDYRRLRERVRRRVRDERELLVHPAYFAALASLQDVAHVDVVPRRGSCASEMQRFRYNAVIYVRGSDARPERADRAAARGLRWIDWQEAALSLDGLLAEVERTRPDALALRGVPNALVSEDCAVWLAAIDATPALEVAGVGTRGARVLGQGDAGDGCRDADAAGVFPEDLREGAAQVGYEVALSWARGTSDGSFDAVLFANGDGSRRYPRWRWPTGATPAELANDPLAPVQRSELATRVRASLGERLPAYMTPTAVSVLEELPRTANGKLDRAALAERAMSEKALAWSGATGAKADAHDAREAGDRDGPASTIEQTLARAWSEVLGRGEVARDVNFFAAGGTSLLAIRVAVRLLSRGLAVSAQDLFLHQTIAELAVALAVRVGTGEGGVCGGAITPIDDAPTGGSRGAPCYGPADRLGPSRAPAGARAARKTDASRSGRVDVSSVTSASSVLLTGATGFLGIHLLRELLAQGVGRVTCLVRASDDGRAEARIADQWRWYFPGVPLPRGRVAAVAGDIARSGLGLDARSHRALARHCEHAIHAAADVRHVGDTAEIFQANVDGTRHVLELVHSGQRTRLHHVSTIGVKGVMPGDRERAFSERDLDVGQTPTEDYSASKLEAERIVQRSLAKQAGGTVMRVGTIAADSRTGRIQRDAWRNFFLRYLRATVELGLGCDWPGRSLALAPVDLLARAVILLADLGGAAAVETFHVSTPHTVTHGQLIRALQDCGYEISVLERDELVERALERAREPRWESAVGCLLGLMNPPAGRPLRLDANWTLAKLRGAGLQFPPPTTPWLKRLIADCVRTGALPPPSRPAAPRRAATRT
jgi:amino acid adenylation domain-containing protein/thioester reductase-like protein